jgi:hypothetical protein
MRHAVLALLVLALAEAAARDRRSHGPRFGTRRAMPRLLGSSFSGS